MSNKIECVVKDILKWKSLYDNGVITRAELLNEINKIRKKLGYAPLPKNALDPILLQTPIGLDYGQTRERFFSQYCGPDWWEPSWIARRKAKQDAKIYEAVEREACRRGKSLAATFQAKEQK